jgi:hypothetical protein
MRPVGEKHPAKEQSHALDPHLLLQSAVRASGQPRRRRQLWCFAAAAGTSEEAGAAQGEQERQKHGVGALVCFFFFCCCFFSDERRREIAPVGHYHGLERRCRVLAVHFAFVVFFAFVLFASLFRDWATIN